MITNVIVGASIGLALAFVAAWAVEQYQFEHEIQYAVTGAVAVIVSGALVAYGALFQRKTRNL